VSYDWPGNIRELRNCIETAFTICENDEIQVNDILHNIQINEIIISRDDISFRDAKARVIGEFEKGFMINLLNKHDGNISASAKEAKMDKKNFWELMKKREIKYEEYKKK